MTSSGAAFIERSRHYLSSEYLPKLRRCLHAIRDEDLWWRPNPESNSVGNLLLHMVGNIRQWVIGGVGGEADRREREKEFSAAYGPGREELMEVLEAVLAEVDAVLATLGPERLLERRRIQGAEVTVLDAVYHAVEHFAMHTGQVIYITKLRTGTDLGFYEFEAGTARKAW
jgi:uncharacterized damage-inducible protein DinB